LKTSGLNDESRAAIASRLKSRTRLAYDQIRTVETYTTLSTCRREHLLRHFGDTEEVAPCAGCDVCLGEVQAVAVGGVSWDTSSMPLPGGAPFANGSGGASSAEIDPELFERLRGWRGEQARSQGVPAYVVLHNSHLEEISRHKPKNVHELGTIKGIGLRRAARYGEEILALVNGAVEPEEPEPTVYTPPEDAPDFREHLAAAERLLRSGRGAAAVPELARALEAGGKEAKEAVDALLATGVLS
jgi:ATP-dependent DNA helicase RecQ